MNAFFQPGDGPCKSPSLEITKAILDSATDYAIITTDLQGRITSWNVGAERLLGWTGEEVCGGPAAVFYTESDRAIDVPRGEMDSALRTGRGNDERWHQRKDGSCFWASGEMMPLQDDAGQPVGFLKILRDRTAERLREEDRLAAAKALEASDALKAAMLDAALDCIITIADDSTVIEWNRAAEETFGHSRDFAIGRDLAELIIPREYRDAHRRGMAHFLATGEGPILRRRIELEALRADGSLFPVELAVSPIRSEGRARFTAYLRDLSERRMTENQLQETERRLNAVLDNATVSIFLMDECQQCVYMNAAAEKLTGYTLGEAKGRTLHEVVHHTRPDGRHFPIEECPIDRAFPENNQVQGEEVFVHKDGSFYPIAFTASPVRGENAKTVGTIIEVRDISQEKAAQETLRESEARLRIAVDAGRMAVWEIDLRTDTLKGSPALNRVLGFPEDASPTLEEVRSHYFPGERERLAALGQEALSSGDPFAETEFRFLAPDGELLWLLIRAEIQFDEHGQPSRYIGVVVDVTDRKQAEEELQRLNETLERRVEEKTAERDSIWRHSNDLMAVMDFSGRRRAINPAWTRTLGHDEEALLTAPFVELSHPDDRERLMQAVQQLAEGNPIFGFEERLRHKDGSYRLVSWTGVPGKDVFYAIGRDVTEQRATEDALRQSQKMEAVGQLTGGIAHDFNNLLQGIVGSLDIVQKRIGQGRAADAERFITGAMTSANRAAALTHRLLAFSRRQPLDPKPVKANQLVASMEDLLRRTMGEQIGLELVLAGGLWLTKCDPNQLESAILNLVINARDAMPEGGKLTIETCNAHLDSAYAATAREVDPGQYVCICVTDTGVGMRREVIERAFDPFFTTKPIGQGTGLGLSMIYGFARQSEGYAKIYSEEGRGTTFKLYLPRFRGDGENEEPVPELSEKHLAHEGEVVVVVEDEPVVRGLIVEVLSELGYQALEAADGPSGIQLLERLERVDLLVTDIGLPGLNGRQVADAARVRRPDLKVLFMTGYAENAALANGFLEPGMEMITKPVAMEVLASKIKNMIES